MILNGIAVWLLLSVGATTGWVLHALLAGAADEDHYPRVVDFDRRVCQARHVRTIHPSESSSPRLVTDEIFDFDQEPA